MMISPTPATEKSPLTRAVTARLDPGGGAILLLLLAGGTLGLTYPGFLQAPKPLGAWISMLAWGAPLVFFYYIGRSGEARDDFDRAQAFALGTQAMLVSWVLSLYPLNGLFDSPLKSAVIVGIAWLGMAIFYSLCFAFWGMAYGVLVRRFLAVKGPTWALPILAGAFWAVFEWIGTLGPLAYPWATLATTQIANLPFLQLLPLGGPYLLGGLMAAFACGMAEGVRAWRAGSPFPRISWIMIGLTLGGWLFGYLAMRPTPDGNLKVAAVQGNYERGDKWNPSKFHLMASRYLELSASAQEAQLVVWPETPLPTFWNLPPATSSVDEVARFRAAFRRPGRYLVSGGFFSSLAGSRDGEVYNAATVLGPGLDAWRIEPKRHLAPLGEFLPFRQFLPPFLAKFNMLGRDLTPGQGGTPLAMPLATLGTGICFDAYFPRALADDTRAGATVLAVLANDDWLQKTFAPHLSFANAVLRAVENRRFLIRVGNSGITALIDPFGRVTASVPPYQQTVLRGEVRPLSELTPYTRWGDWPAMLGAIVLAAAALFSALRPTRKG